MSSYHAWTHLPKAQGGTDPLVFDDKLVAILSGWEAIDTGEFIPDAWASVSADGFFNDSYDSGEGVSVDLDAASMTFPTKTLVQVTAYAQFFGDFDEGDVVGVAISGTWGRIINAVTCDVLGIPGAEKIGVSASVRHPTSPMIIGLQVFHTHATDMTLAGCEISAFSVSTLDDALWEVHA